MATKPYSYRYLQHTTMKDYLLLQLRLITRKINEAGVSPMVGITVLTTLFIGVSYLLFAKINYAQYIYPFIALSFMLPLSNVKRNEFLQLCYGDTQHRRLRLAENLLVALPFAVFMLFKLQLPGLGLVILLAVTISFIKTGTATAVTIPTPFGKIPYEFAAGFRNTILVILVVYTLAVIAVVVGNFNLGAFALLLLFAVTLSYYQLPEPEYFVWNHNMKPAAFLLHKTKTAIGYATLLALPVVLLLCSFFISQVLYVALLVLAGYVYLCCMIAARYSTYPNEINLPEGILLAISIGVPPALIAILPYFINRSLKRLSTVLK
jgi:hypothetical protein